MADTRRGRPTASRPPTSAATQAADVAQGTPCPCCDGTGRLDTNRRPLCATAVKRRDTRSPDQLERLRLAFLQRGALRGIAFDDNGRPLPEHGRPYVDYVTGEVTR
jgi:hypothetical protein